MAAPPQLSFPRPLRPGDLIAVTAPSSGVAAPAHARLDLVLQHLRERGFRVREGQCLRAQHQDASAGRQARADEFNHFLRDPEVAAVLPPWGGELASELLALIDFDGLRSVPPKWLMGFSDLSTLLLPLTLVSGWATAHGPNLMDLAPTQTDPLTTGALGVLAHDFALPVRQCASEKYQTQWTDFAVRADAPLNLTQPTAWQRLDGDRAPLRLQGRLIGGCLDTIAWLAGSRYGDIPAFVRGHAGDGVILYLENVEMAPTGLVRALLALQRHGWFNGLAGLLLGRSAGPVPAEPGRLGYLDALRAVLGALPCPVLVDVDIGHQPPQFTLINGAWAQVSFADGRGDIVQAARP